LNLLGAREPSIYGEHTLEQVDQLIQEKASRLQVRVETFQSNHEGTLVEQVQQASGEYAGILINPAALTHYSIALHDALKAAGLPVVEVHLSNIYAREEFRRLSVISPVAGTVISGAGVESYLLGVEALVSLINKRT